MNQDKLMAIHRMAQEAHRLAEQLTHAHDGAEPAMMRLCQALDVAQSQAGELVERYVSGEAAAENRPRSVRREMRRHQ